jgi:hypothetical protein
MVKGRKHEIRGFGLHAELTIGEFVVGVAGQEDGGVQGGLALNLRS